jgi:hypothetical protein
MIDAQSISDALGGRKYGKGYRSACPACGGSDKSTKFSMTDTSDRVLVHCHAGCLFTDIVTELRSRGLWPEPEKLPYRQALEYRKNKLHDAIEAALNHELNVLIQFVGWRVADRQLVKDKRFREQRLDWRPMPGTHWERELLAAQRIKKALGVLYG